MQPKIFTEQASTYEEAERKAFEKYGERLTILTREAITLSSGFLGLFPKEGVKISGIINQSSKTVPHREALYQRETASQGLVPANSYIRESIVAKAPLPRELSPSRESLRSSLRETMSLREPSSLREPLDFEEEKEKVLALANQGKENSALKEVLAEVRKIKEKIEDSGLASSREEHPTLNRLEDALILNDFPPAYRKELLGRVRKELSLDTLNSYEIVESKVIEWIGQSIKIYENDKFNVRPRIMVVVGPTGIGKTTTVAKLAANFGINEKGYHKRNIVLVTIDAYRIGAKEQLEKFSEWMEFPFFSATDYDELKKIIATNSEKTDLFLIDTIGKNPRDAVKLGEMKSILDACGSLAEFHLAVAATTKSSDLGEILQQFEMFNYKSVIVTKTDETIPIGNIIGVLSEKGKSISYVTNGQTVPTDIKKASIVQFLMKLEGFRVNRIRMEEKFPDNGGEQMQQWR